MDVSLDFPYRAEYSKSNRASCRQCKGNIEKGVLRLAVLVQSPAFDGKITHWYHYMCFFAKQRPKKVEDIAHFDSLRWEDQQKIKKKIEEGGALGAANGKKKSGKGSDFSIEYAKSSRAACRNEDCGEKIPKDEIRICKMDYEGEKAKRFGPMPLWHHVDCFVKVREELEFFDSAENLPGFNTLSADDKKVLRAKLVKMEKKRKAEDEVDGPAKKIKSENDQLMKKQSKKMYHYRDRLEKNLKKSEMAAMLNFNGYPSFPGESKMLDVLADLMTFGVIEKCSACKTGNFVYKFGIGYMCIGDMSEWTKCRNIVEEPKRTPFLVPEEFKTEFDFLNEYKFKEYGHRIVIKRPESEIKPASNGTEKKVKALSGYSFAIVVSSSSQKKKIASKVTELGGDVTSKVTASTAAVIITPDKVNETEKKMKEAVTFGVHCVPEDFLEEVEVGGAALMIKKKNIAPWAKDLEPRIELFQKSKSKSKSSKSSMYEKIPEKMKITLKDGNYIDPDSGLSDTCHVYKRGDKIYSVVLGVVDLVRGTNSYYKMQVLESDKKHRWFVFRKWGRVGTTIGDHRVQKFTDPKDALDAFNEVYEEKTANRFKSTEQKKVPGFWFPLEMDHGQKQESKLAKPNLADSKSKLPRVVQELVSLIFDVNSMEKTMIEYELDLKKMPLGKLSSRQLEKALLVLSEALDILKKRDEEDNKEANGIGPLLVDCSNRFYTLLPHDFGMKNPPILDSQDMIKNKIDMIDSLREIEIAYNLLKSEHEAGEIDPIDECYEKLKTSIVPVDRATEEFKLIESYVANTHAATHSHYKLSLDEVFHIEREGEKKRYKPFKKLPNRQLLWHGSRLTNYAGILSQGLRIAPPEAPSTGYMFGKGIYFADMVSKSANYCCTSTTKPTGLLLLCEVALGNMYELKHAKDIKKLPSGKHSTKGLGKTRPNPKDTVTLPEGIEVPIGKPDSTDVKNCDLLYNEYIVYDVAQVNVKYLVKTTFNYKI